MMPLDFLSLGIAVIPCYYRTKRPAIAWQRYQVKLPTRDEVLAWSRPGHRTNWAVICGHRNLVVLDFDTLAAYEKWRLWASTKPLVAPVAAQTYQVSSSRGKHVYVLCDESPRSGHFDGGDVKGKGGYVLIPPSVHPSGKPYASDEPDAPILRVARLADVLPDPPRVAPAAPLPLTNVASAARLWPKTDSERIREQFRIQDLIPDAKPSGGKRWMIARCPGHPDHSPSLRLDLDYQVATCFAGCNNGRPMDSVRLYGLIHGLTNKQAFRELAKLL